MILKSGFVVLPYASPYETLPPMVGSRQLGLPWPLSTALISAVLPDSAVHAGWPGAEQVWATQTAALAQQVKLWALPRRTTMDISRPRADGALILPLSMMSSGSGTADGVSPGNSGGGDDESSGGGGEKKNRLNASFRMSGRYEAESQSQLSIGVRVIDHSLLSVAQLASASRAKTSPPVFSFLDLACGPGVLTVEAARQLHKSKGSTIPANYTVRVDGLDIDPGILARAADRAREEILDIAYHCADFRQPPERLQGRYDLVFSSEGLHWTAAPPDVFTRQEYIFYRLLPQQLSNAFARWAAEQWHSALKGIASFLRPGGCALLQFGAEGQLDALYNLFDHILSLPRFRCYKPNIWFPIYYPSPKVLPQWFEEEGFEVLDLQQWQEPLTEQTPAEVIQFVRGWTQPYFATVMQHDDVEAFYAALHAALSGGQALSIAQITWQRTAVIARRVR